MKEPVCYFDPQKPACPSSGARTTLCGQQWRPFGLDVHATWTLKHVTCGSCLASLARRLELDK